MEGASLQFFGDAFEESSKSSWKTHTEMRPGVQTTLYRNKHPLILFYKAHLFVIERQSYTEKREGERDLPSASHAPIMQWQELGHSDPGASSRSACGFRDRSTWTTFHCFPGH